MRRRVGRCRRSLARARTVGLLGCRRARCGGGATQPIPGGRISHVRSRSEGGAGTRLWPYLFARSAVLGGHVLQLLVFRRTPLLADRWIVVKSVPRNTPCPRPADPAPGWWEPMYRPGQRASWRSCTGRLELSSTSAGTGRPVAVVYHGRVRAQRVGPDRSLRSGRSSLGVCRATDLAARPGGAAADREVVRGSLGYLVRRAASASSHQQVRLRRSANRRVM